MTVLGRPFMIALFFLFASVAAFSQTPAGGRDLQTELHKFWPDSVDYDNNVWELHPVEMSQLDVLPSGGFIIKANVGSHGETFYFNGQGNGPVEFDSDEYKFILKDQSAPTVKGIIVSVRADYDKSGTYIAVIYDKRILDIKGKPVLNDNASYCVPYTSVKEADFDDASSNDQLYVTGIPVLKYGPNGGNTSVIPPKFVVKVFKVTHAVGDFLESHNGKKFTGVRITSLDKSKPIVSNILNNFKNDYLFPFVTTFDFGSDYKESYIVFKTSSGNSILVVSGFAKSWQP